MDSSMAQRTASLYVGDLPTDLSNPEEALGKLFGKVGPVASIRVCRDMNTQRSLGYAYVNFQNPADAEKAIESLNYTEISTGYPMRVMPSMRDPILRRTGANNLFVKNIDKTFTAKDLHEAFSKYGRVLSVKVSRDSEGKSLGYGFLQLESAEAAKTALKADGERIGECAVTVTPFIRKVDRLAQEEKTFVNVYAKNIRKEVTESDIRDVFEKFGEVKSVFLSSHPQHETKFSLVSFSTHDAAVAAIEALNDSEGSPIATAEEKLLVCRALKKRERYELERKVHALYQNQGRNLYVKHLDDSVTREKLEELFSSFGTITSCALMRDSAGVSREFGFVCFESKESAAAALREMNGKSVYNKPLYVSYAEQKDMRRRILLQKMQRVTRQQQQQQLPASTPAYTQPWSRSYPANTFFGPPFMQSYDGRRMPPPQLFPSSSVPMPPPPMMNWMTRRVHYTQTPPPPPPPPPLPLPQPQQMPQQSQRHQQIQPSQSVAEDAWNASQLAKLSPEEKRNILGEKLFNKVVQVRPSQAAKITGMLLEMETQEILAILDVPPLLMAKVEEAVVVLQQHSNGA